MAGNPKTVDSGAGSAPARSYGPFASPWLMPRLHVSALMTRVMSQEGQNTILSLSGRCQFETAIERPLDRSGSPSLKYDGIDVGFAADRRGIAKCRRDLLDDLHDFALEHAVAGVRGRGCACEQNSRL